MWLIAITKAGCGTPNSFSESGDQPYRGQLNLPDSVSGWNIRSDDSRLPIFTPKFTKPHLFIMGVKSPEKKVIAGYKRYDRI